MKQTENFTDTNKINIDLVFNLVYYHNENLRCRNKYYMRV